ncbi:hypothetical protein CERSUDRAFT_71185 [Gelatoporia subvermispora B]|uniref:Uncharacterized protein n=1 Tax=Ceriporiopsis subvermispora (strain B) TaxID=914234 RepID=M2RR81_CERS8|nr:hypothetical protein CERSUDRAFT_71185 [Gelatoporia subvermispora B]
MNQNNPANAPLPAGASTQEPGIDIRSELEDILSGDLQSSGAFSFHRTYTNTPTPSFTGDGLGPIALPLKAQEVEALKSVAEQAPFGKGERTIVDKNVRDTWQIDASKVHFAHSAWQYFLQKAVEDVCKALGVSVAMSLPRCEPYKLLLYETGSHSEKADDMFATMVIVLPSPFTGGAIRVSHGSASETYDDAPNSAHSTSVLAWYTDVMHKHVLHTWTRTGRDGPLKVVYLLAHKYTRAGLCGSALKGKDTELVAMLAPLMQGADLRLGLATVEYHVTGPAAEEYCSDDLIPEYPLDMAERDETELSLKQGLALTGNGFDLYQISDILTIKHSGYHGSVLVIWTKRNHYELLYCDAGFEQACTELHLAHPQATSVISLTTSSITPGSVNQKCSSLSHRYAQLHRVKGCNATRSVDTFGKATILHGLETFGFDKISWSIESTLENEPRNIVCLQLLDDTEKWAASRSDPELSHRVHSWALQRQNPLLQSLKKPKKGESAFLISLATNHGGMKFMQSTILPQVIASEKTTFMVELAEALLKTEFEEQAESDVQEAVVRALLGTAVSKVNIYKGFKGGRINISNCFMTGRDITAKIAEKALDRATHYINVCLTAGDEEDIGPTFDKLLDLSSVEPQTALTNTEFHKAKVDIMTPGAMHTFAEALDKMREKFALPGSESLDVDSMILRVVGKYAQAVDLSIITRGGSAVPLTVDILDFCLRMHCEIMGRILEPANLFPKNLSKYLLPLILESGNLVRKHGIAPTSPSCAPTFRTVVSSWAEKVLGPKPGDLSV